MLTQCSLSDFRPRAQPLLSNDPRSARGMTSPHSFISNCCAQFLDPRSLLSHGIASASTQQQEGEFASQQVRACKGVPYQNTGGHLSGVIPRADGILAFRATISCDLTLTSPAPQRGSGDASHEALQRLESRMSAEVARVEREAQEANQAVVAELNKWKKDREICWKHVAELKVRDVCAEGDGLRPSGSVRVGASGA